MPCGSSVWISAERLAELQRAVPGGRTEPPLNSLDSDVDSAEAALRELVRSRMEGLGPATAAQLGRPLGLTAGDVAGALAALEAEGFAMRGQFSERATESSLCEQTQEEWCDRRLLARIHRYTLKRLRSEIERSPSPTISGSCSVGRAWARSGGRAARRWRRSSTNCKVWHCPPAAWEREVLPARLREYSPLLMDDLADSGRIAWIDRLSAGIGVQADEGGPRRGRAPWRIRPLSFCRVRRSNVETVGGVCKRLGRRDPALHRGVASSRFAGGQGALFFQELVQASGLLRVQTVEALAELVAGGLVTADAFRGLRVLITPPRPPQGLSRPAATARTEL